jgi:hypothetical protein
LHAQADSRLAFDWDDIAGNSKRRLAGLAPGRLECLDACYNCNNVMSAVLHAQADSRLAFDWDDIAGNSKHRLASIAKFLCLS